MRRRERVKAIFIMRFGTSIKPEVQYSSWQWRAKKSAIIWCDLKRKESEEKLQEGKRKNRSHENILGRECKIKTTFHLKKLFNIKTSQSNIIQYHINSTILPYYRWRCGRELARFAPQFVLNTWQSNYTFNCFYGGKHKKRNHPDDLRFLDYPFCPPPHSSRCFYIGILVYLFREEILWRSCGDPRKYMCAGYLYSEATVRVLLNVSGVRALASY